MQCRSYAQGREQEVQGQSCTTLHRAKSISHHLKSSVFAEFSDAASVDAFLKADPAPTFAGQPLVIMSKSDYCEMKIKEKGLSGSKAQFRREAYSTGAGGGGGGRGGFNAFKDMGKSGGSGDAKEKPEVWLEFMGSKVRVHEDEEGKGYVKDEEVHRVKGATLTFTGADENVKFDDIKVCNMIRDEALADLIFA